MKFLEYINKSILVLIIFLFSTISSVKAEETETLEVIKTLQKDLKTLEKAVYSQSSDIITASKTKLSSNDEDVLTRHLLKLSEIEKQFQDLTNKFEEINFKIDKLSSRLSKVQADNQLRFQNLEGEDIEVAFTHARGYGEDYSSFVNGQHTTQGGTHLSAFREAIARVIKDFFNKYEPVDIRQGIVAAVSVKVMEPVFESQTKTKLGSLEIEPNGKSVRAFVMDFLKEKLDNFLHRNPDVVKDLENKIKQSEKERKELAGIRKIARERAKKENN